mgnify:FL=1
MDEIDEDDFDVEEEEAPQRAVQSATSEAHELLKKEVAAATAKDSKPVRNLLSLQHRLRRQHRRRKQLRRFMRKKRINQLRSRNWQSQDIHRRSLLRKQRKKEMLLTL